MTYPASSVSAARDHILALNGTEERLQAVLGRVEAAGVRLVALQEWVAPGRGMKMLMPSIERMFAGLDLAPRRIGRIACVRGPGSFTGLRLVLSSALGLSKALDVPLAGIDHLPLLARNAAPLLPDGATLWCVTHARRAQVFMQGFIIRRDAAQAVVTPFGPPRALRQEEATAAIVAHDASSSLHAQHIRPPYLLGTGLRRNAPFFATALPHAMLLPETADIPQADTLLAVAAEAPCSRAPLVPLYLSGSDAEDNLAHIAATQGVALDASKARLDALTTA